MKSSMLAGALALALILNTVSALPALAYVDPNTGGMLFQLLAVLFATLSATLLFFSARLRMTFARIRRFLRSIWNRLFTR